MTQIRFTGCVNYRNGQSDFDRSRSINAAQTHVNDTNVHLSLAQSQRECRRIIVWETTITRASIDWTYLNTCKINTVNTRDNISAIWSEFTGFWYNEVLMRCGLHVTVRINRARNKEASLCVCQFMAPSDIFYHEIGWVDTTDKTLCFVSST